MLNLFIQEISLDEKRCSLFEVFLVFSLARHRHQAAAEQDMKVMLSLARCAVLNTALASPSFY
jgi:hypothetical protein